jgi:NAD(P)-dependent dehydrogenase (short-subunit alcohol dehydrogenase family)
MSVAKVSKLSRAEQYEALLEARLKDQVVLVTGANSGIGAATAREFAWHGAQVVLAARRANELEAQAEEFSRLGLRAKALPTDLSDSAQITRLVEQTLEAYGRIDVLVNNAGIGMIRPYYKDTPEEIEHLINVNVLGTMLLTRAVLPSMLERRSGAIITVASVAGIIAIDPLYSASKFGLRGFADALRRQLLGSGISVSLVSPGYIRTPMNAGARGSWFMAGPEVVARAICGLVLKPRREIIVPGYYAPLVALSSGLPWLVDLGMRIGNRSSRRR